MKKIKIMSLVLLSSLLFKAPVFSGLVHTGLYHEKFGKDVFDGSKKEDIKWDMSLPAKNLKLIKIENNALEINYNPNHWSYAYFDIDESDDDQMIEGIIKLETTDPSQIMIYSLKEDKKSDGPIASSNITENQKALFKFDKNDKEIKIQFFKNSKTKYRFYIHPQKLNQTGKTFIKEIELQDFSIRSLYENNNIPNSLHMDEGFFSVKNSLQFQRYGADSFDILDPENGVLTIHNPSPKKRPGIFTKFKLKKTGNNPYICFHFLMNSETPSYLYLSNMDLKKVIKEKVLKSSEEFQPIKLEVNLENLKDDQEFGLFLTHTGNSNYKNGALKISGVGYEFKDITIDPVKLPLELDAHNLDGKLEKLFKEGIQLDDELTKDKNFGDLQKFEDAIDDYFKMLPENSKNETIINARKFVEILKKDRQGNNDKINNINAEDLFVRVFRLVKKLKNDFVYEMLAEQLSDLRTGPCPQGRTSRLYQVYNTLLNAGFIN
jgi:hypothetical protein